MSTSNDAVFGRNARLCLDLGTAMSKASVLLDGAVAPLPIGIAANAGHALLTPSAMYVEENRLYFGPSALARAQCGVVERRSPIVSFKLVLSAREVEATLALKLSRSVDPTSSLSHRDGIVLYLAYLDQLARAAVAAEPDIPNWVADAPRRLTSPHWQSFEEAGRIVAGLVDEAMTVSREMGVELLYESGIAMTQGRVALDRARNAPTPGYFDGIVSESLSAASAYVNFAHAVESLVLVIDMGAGTTDIAGFEREGTMAPAKLTEIEGASQCCPLAGDELDNILIDLFVRASGNHAKDAQDRLWRAVKLSAAQIKREMFEKGWGVFRDRKREVRVSRAALEKNSSFRAYCNALSRTVGHSLRPLHARAKASRAGTITVLLAGGGANLPFLADVVRKAAAREKVKIKLKIERFGANWTLPYRHHPFAGAFPQLAIAMGGALAAVVQQPARAPIASPV